MPTEEFDERVRVQSLLYPWVSLSVLVGRFSTFASDSLKAKGKPKQDVRVILEDISKVVRWDVKNDTVSIETHAAGGYDGIALLFKKAEDAVCFFEHGRLSSAVFLNKTNIFDWSRFLIALLGVQKMLGNRGWSNLSDEKLYDKTRLTLYSAVVGLNGLGKIDDFSGSLMHHLPDGVLRVRIGGIGGDVCAIKIEDGCLTWLNRVPETESRSVDFEFKDIKSAWKCVANLSDNLAAVGKGDIKLRGFIPLADGFNHMLDRLQMYVTA